MSTITADMPIQLSTGKASASGKTGTESGQFEEIMKSQGGKHQENTGTAPKKEMQDKAVADTTANLNIRQLPLMFMFPGMPIPQIIAGAANAASKDGAINPNMPEIAAAVSKEASAQQAKPAVAAQSAADVPKGTVAGDMPQTENKESGQTLFNVSDSKVPVPEATDPELPRNAAVEQKSFTEAMPGAEGNQARQMAETSVVQTDGKPVTGNTKLEKEPDTKDKVSDLHVQDTVQQGNTAESTSVVKRTPEAKPETYKTDIRPEYMEQIKSNITDSLAAGKREFEIQLNPANLGKLVIKASYEAGRAMISIVCTEARTMEAMSQQARELGAIVENRTGNQTVVVVEHPAEDYLQQQGNQQGSQQDSGSEGQKQKEKSQSHESIDFIQQLRLGLA